jgi:hypothetical protein
LFGLLTQAVAELRSRFGLGWDDGAPLALRVKRDEAERGCRWAPTSDITLASLQRAAVMVGRRVSIELV